MFSSSKSNRCSCDDTSCPFYHLPFCFQHNCHLDNATDREDEEALSSCLGLVFIVAMVQHELAYVMDEGVPCFRSTQLNVDAVLTRFHRYFLGEDTLPISAGAMERCYGMPTALRLRSFTNRVIKWYEVHHDDVLEECDKMSYILIRTLTEWGLHHFVSSTKHHNHTILQEIVCRSIEAASRHTCDLWRLERNLPITANSTVAIASNGEIYVL